MTVAWETSEARLCRNPARTRIAPSPRALLGIATTRDGCARDRQTPPSSLSGCSQRIEKKSPHRFGCSGLDGVRAMTTDASDPRPLNGLFAEPANTPEAPAAHATERTRTHAPEHLRGHVPVTRWVGSPRYLLVAVAAAVAGFGLAHVVAGSTHEPVSGRAPAPAVVNREASPTRRVAPANPHAARRTRLSHDRRRLPHGHRGLARTHARSVGAPPRLHLTRAAQVGPRREPAPSWRPTPARVRSREFF